MENEQRRICQVAQRVQIIMEAALIRSHRTMAQIGKLTYSSNHNIHNRNRLFIKEQTLTKTRMLLSRR